MGVTNEQLKELSDIIFADMPMRNLFYEMYLGEYYVNDVLKGKR